MSDFSNILISPQYSDLDSREDVSLEHKGLKLPFVGAPMDTVTNMEVADAMARMGAFGVVHRYFRFDELVEIANKGYAIAVSPSMGKEFLGKLEKENTLVLDVAHGDSKNALRFAEMAVSYGHNVISANIVRGAAARRYYNVGVKTFRVGIGGGGACTTREVAGIGFPQADALREIREEIPDANLISDGGVKNTGDIVKALALGADWVMMGGMFAGCKETPQGTAYRGMASYEARKDADKDVDAIEGRSTQVAEDVTIPEKLEEMASAVRAGLAYTGSKDVAEFHKKAL